MSYEEIYETYQEVAKEHINRDLFNHSSEDAAETIEDIKNKGAKATIEELLEKMNNKHLNNIHLSYDIDCLDPSYVPGTGTPVNNGLTFEESQVLLHGIFSTSHVKCIDFVEYNPTLDKDNKTKETCIQLINLMSEELH